MLVPKHFSTARWRIKLSLIWHNRYAAKVFIWIQIGHIVVMHVFTSKSVLNRADAVIDPWLTSFWEKLFALYPSVADVIPLREDEL